MKKKHYIALSALVIFLSVIVYLSNFRLKEDAIREAIIDFSHNSLENPTLHLLQEIDDSKHFVGYYTTDDLQTGYILLKQGWNHKYKILQIGYGTNTIQARNFEIKKENYIAVYGGNHNIKADYLEIELVGATEKIQLKNMDDDYFLYVEKKNEEFPPSIRAYDQNGEELLF